MVLTGVYEIATDEVGEALGMDVLHSVGVSLAALPPILSLFFYFGKQSSPP